MIVTKKMRQSSRFYNCTLRKNFSDVSRVNQVESFKQRLFKDRRARFERAKWAKSAPVYLAPAMNQQREGNVTKTSFWRGLVKKVLGI